MFVKSLVVICCLAAVVLAEEKYPDKYDNVNIDEILENDKLLEGYFKCIMGTGKCTPEGKQLKETMPDALQTGCAKCTDAQRNGTKKVIHHLIEHKPEYWKELCAKYDPEGTWRKKYENEAKENGIVIPAE